MDLLRANTTWKLSGFPQTLLSVTSTEVFCAKSIIRKKSYDFKNFLSYNAVDKLREINTCYVNFSSTMLVTAWMCLSIVSHASSNPLSFNRPKPHWWHSLHNQARINNTLPTDCRDLITAFNRDFKDGLNLSRWPNVQRRTKPWTQGWRRDSVIASAAATQICKRGTAALWLAVFANRWVLNLSSIGV